MLHSNLAAQTTAHIRVYGDSALLRQTSHGVVCFRERANLQLANRRLERKVKEMVMQGEEEQHSLQDQKDQVRHHTSPLR